MHQLPRRLAAVVVCRVQAAMRRAVCVVARVCLAPDRHQQRGSMLSCRDPRLLPASASATRAPALPARRTARGPATTLSCAAEIVPNGRAPAAAAAGHARPPAGRVRAPQCRAGRWVPCRSQIRLPRGAMEAAHLRDAIVAIWLQNRQKKFGAIMSISGDCSIMQFILPR